jgi:hypothetical protein
MLAKVEVEDEYIFDGVLTTMDQENNVITCPTHVNRHKLK